MSAGTRLLVALVVGLATTVASAQGGGAARPQYLPFAEFSSDESASHVAIKQGYNEAVERYNKALYAYHVILGQHDQLVEQASRSQTTPAEREKARADAAPLRARLQTLRGEVTSLAAAVDQARQRASQAGVTLTR
jgi:hypothetical protein